MNCKLTSSPADLELCLHRFFADRRLNGEWFRLNKQEVRWLMSQKQMNVSDL